MAYKPDGYTDLSPYLIVADAETALQFCEQVLEGERLRVFPNATGGIMHAECRIGDSVLMMGEADGPSAMLHLYLPDPDAMHARALAFGATEIEPMNEKGDGDRRGGVRSADGTQWYFSRQVGDS